MALSKFHGSARETIRRACEEALLREGFVSDPVEENSDGKGHSLPLLLPFPFFLSNSLSLSLFLLLP